MSRLLGLSAALAVLGPASAVAAEETSARAQRAAPGRATPWDSPL